MHSSHITKFLTYKFLFDLKHSCMTACSIYKWCDTACILVSYHAKLLSSFTLGSYIQPYSFGHNRYWQYLAITYFNTYTL